MKKNKDMNLGEKDTYLWKRTHGDLINLSVDEGINPFKVEEGVFVPCA